MRAWPTAAACCFGAFGLLVGTTCACAGGVNSAKGSVGYEIPRALQGHWERSDALSEEEDMREIEFGDPASRIVVSDRAMRCRVAGVRSMTPTRWYLDLACGDGRLVDLDINRVGEDSLLVARRPLGQAGVFNRRDAFPGNASAATPDVSAE